MNKRKRTVITYGTFDLFHEGHLNLLKRAKALGDFLIVGVTSESYDRQRGKLNVKQSLAERIENVRQSGLADMIIVEEYEGQKIEDILRYNVDIFVIGSDWKGKFDYLKPYCEVVYLERTKGISSTKLRGNVRIGIVGTGRIARRFVPESKFVSGAFVTAVYHPSESKAREFAKLFELKWGGNNWNKFLKEVDAVYIASPHDTHVDYATKSLEAGKHVLCEKPMAIKKCHAEYLFELASKNGAVILEAIKTAFLPAFKRAIGTALSGTIGEVHFVEATFSKLVKPPSREFDCNKLGGSFFELGTYVLLPIVKLFGSSVWDAKVDFLTWKPFGQVDLWTLVQVVSDKFVGMGKVGIGLKGEGNLVIWGSEGYIYVPSPWWKTGVFEIRREDPKENRLIADSFEGEGLRYEIAEWLKLISERRLSSSALRPEESIWIASVMERFYNEFYGIN